MSAAELARRAGLKQSTLARRMTGEIPFDLDDLEAISRVLGVEVGDLIPRGVPASRSSESVWAARDFNDSSLPLDRMAQQRAHTPSGPSPMSPQRRSSTRPVSAVPATRRRPAPVRPVNPPIPAVA